MYLRVKRAAGSWGVARRTPAGKMGTEDHGGRGRVQLGSLGHSRPQYLSVILLPNAGVTK